MRLSNGERKLFALVDDLHRLIQGSPDKRDLGQWLLSTGCVRHVNPEVLVLFDGKMPVTIAPPKPRRSPGSGRGRRGR